MIRSDLRATAPAAVPVIRGLLKGDVVFTNLECAVAEKGETIHEGRGFLTPPEALDALTTFGFNLLSLAGNHAFDLKVTGIKNTLRETESRKIVHAGTGNDVADAAAAGYGEGETQQQPQQRQHRCRHATSILGFLRFSPAMCKAYAPPELRKS